MISRGRRYRKVLAVLAKHGFGDLGIRMGGPLSWFKKSSRQGISAKRWTGFRKALEELGPTYVKFGQVLSNRPGILPDDLTAELARLQDQVPPFPFSTVKSSIEDSFGKPIDELFPFFDPSPVASASIAQVHKAQLPNGQLVAVKVRRPGIEEVIRADVAIMRDIAKLMMRNDELASLKPVELVKAFEKTILAELDFEKELHNVKQFYELFEGDKTVKVPRPYPEFSSSAVVCLEFIDGIKISRKELLTEQGYDLKAIARNGFDAFFKQIFEWGIFHADPHPGNLMVLPGNVIGILDFGMVGQLSQTDRSALVEFVIALGRDDIGRIVENIEKLQGSPVSDKTALERDMSAFLAEFGSKAVKDINLNDALDQGRRMAYKHDLKLNPDLFLLFRTISLLEGIGISLDPQFRSLEIIKPYAFRLLRKQLNPKNIFQSKALLAWAADWYQLIKVLPGDFRKTLSKLSSDQLVLKTESVSIDRLSEQLRKSGNELSQTLMSIALMGFAAFSINLPLPALFAGFNLVGISCLIISLILLIRLIRRWW